MRGLRPFSILLGVLVDKLTFVACALMLAAAVPVSEPAFQMLVMPLGIATLVLGGFAAARHARGEYSFHGVSVGVMGTVISFSRFAVNTLWPPAEAAANHPLWWEVLGWASAPIAGLLGGGLALALAARSPQDPRSGAGTWTLWLPVYLAVIALFAFVEHL